MYGQLGDVLTKEQQDAIFRKICMPDLLQNDPDATSLYGSEHESLAEDFSDGNVPKKRVNDQIYTAHQSSTYKLFDDPRMEKPIAVFKEGMKELLDAMDKKIATHHFETPEEQNMFYQLRGIMEDMHDGTFSEKFRNDPQYEYAHSVLTKIRLTAVAGSAEKDKNTGKGYFESTINQPIDDKANLKIIAYTGISDSTAGALKVARLADEHLKTGDTTREDLINEYTQQLVRAGRHYDLTEKDYNRYLRDNHVVDNDYSDFSANGARGFGYIINDLNAKLDFLKAGYPVADLPAISYFVRKITSYENGIVREQEAIKSLKSKKDPDKDTTDKIREAEARLAYYNEKKRELTELKDEVLRVKPVTETVRLQNLKAVKSALDKIVQAESAEKNDGWEARAASFKLNKRINAPLTAVEKALLTNNVNTMYKLLDKADPKLMKSSRQFAEMKEKLKALAKWQSMMDLSDDNDRRIYKKRMKETLSYISKYLKYKTAQMNDPRKAHKRSETEAKRVKLADAIFNSLKSQCYPGEDEPIAGIAYNAVVLSSGGRRFMNPRSNAKLPVDYDSYIQKHTGRGIINNSKSVMADSLSKVMAAYALKTSAEKRAFDLDEIHKYAAELRKKYALDKMKEKDLQKYLADPEKVRESIREINQGIFGVQIDTGYEKYRTLMAELYMRLPEPGNDAKYRKFYESVEKAAHLPKDIKNLDTTKLEDYIAKVNFDIVNSAKAVIKGKEKTLKNSRTDDRPQAYAVDSLVMLEGVMRDATGTVEQNVQKINHIRGTESTMAGAAYLEEGDFGMRRIKKQEKLRTIAKDRQKEIANGLTDQRKVLKNAANRIVKNKPEIPVKSHDVAGRTNRPVLEPVEKSNRSKEAEPFRPKL